MVISYGTNPSFGGCRPLTSGDESHGTIHKKSPTKHIPVLEDVASMLPLLSHHSLGNLQSVSVGWSQPSTHPLSLNTRNPPRDLIAASIAQVHPG